MKKNGVTELQFNWIFILIAGAIIVVFFFNIIAKQKEFSDIRISSSIITKLESILTGAQVSTGTVNVIDIPKIDIEFECNKYSIVPIPKSTKGNVIFSPGLLKGKRLITWALDWNLPYRVTNFLYLTDPEFRYVIVNNSWGLGKQVYDELPGEMNKELIDENNFQAFTDKNNYKVKFIFFENINSSVLSKLGQMPDEDVTAVNINATTAILDAGTIQFLQKNGTSWKEKGATYYLKKESLFGAIFADDVEMYDCVMKKAFKKLNLVTKIYLERSKKLEKYYGIYDKCSISHNRAVTELDYMEDVANQNSDNFPNVLGSMDAILEYNNFIKQENQRMELFSCAFIY